MKYSKKQIKNSIRYWSRKLNEIEAFELVEAALNDFSNGKFLTESEQSQIIQKIKQEVKSELKDEKDVEKFVKDNDKLVQTKCKSDIFKKIWNVLKAVLKAGLDGLNFIAKYWRVIIMIGTVVLFMKYGFQGLVGKVISIIMKFLNLDEFIKAGAKISDASISAGGYGGWSGAGLGGGLR